MLRDENGPLVVPATAVPCLVTAKHHRRCRIISRWPGFSGGIAAMRCSLGLYLKSGALTMHGGALAAELQLCQLVEIYTSYSV